MNTLDFAKAYVQAGFKVFPVTAGGKNPLSGSHGFKDATDDIEQIEAWWTGTNHGIAIATGAVSNCVVFDIDEEIGLKTIASWGEIPEKAMISSSNKKQDGKVSVALWFKLPKGLTFKSMVRAWEGIDIRACGGYMVVPPSVHPSGSQYSWWASGELPEMPQRFLDELLLVRGKPSKATKERIEVQYLEERLSLDEARALIYNEATKDYTSWYTQAKKKLKKNQAKCYSAVFENGFIPTVGSRFNTLRELIGSAITHLHDVPGTSCQLVLGLFADIIGQIQASEEQAGGNDDFESKAWNMICVFMSSDQADARRKVLDRAKEEAIGKSVVDVMVSGIQKWAGPQIGQLLNASNSDACSWVRRNGLLSYRGSQFYLLNSFGYYDKYPLTEKQIVSEIIQKGLSSVFQVRVMTDKGERWVTKEELQNDCGFNIQNVTYAAVAPENSLGGVVNFENASLTIPAFWRRTDIMPEYNENCDKFLRLMFGSSYHEVEGWLAHALAIEDPKPICGLVISGSKGIGKSLLGRALALCFENGTEIGRVIDGKEGFVSNFNAGFKESPILYIDEGVEVAKMGKQDISIPFRQMIGSEYHSVNQKNRDLVRVKSNVRVLVTTNETTTVDTLVGNCLGADSYEAVSQRIKYIDIQVKDAEAVKKFLEDNGHWTMTNKWLLEEAQLVKHLFWLFAQKRASHPEAGRFLVDGGLKLEKIQSLKIKDGINGQLLRAIIDEIIKKAPVATTGEGATGFTKSLFGSEGGNSLATQSNGIYFDEKEKEVFVLRDACIRLLDKVSDIDKKIDGALEVISVRPANPIWKNKQKKRWCKVHRDMILRYAEECQMGEKVKLLFGVVEEEPVKE